MPVSGNDVNFSSVTKFSDTSSPLSSDHFALQWPMSFELVSPHGLAQFEVQQQHWLGIDLQCVTQNISAKKSWQSLASDKATVLVVFARVVKGFASQGSESMLLSPAHAMTRDIP